MPWAHFIIGLLGVAVLLVWYAGKKAGYEEGFSDGRNTPRLPANPENHEGA